MVEKSSAVADGEAISLANKSDISPEKKTSGRFFFVFTFLVGLIFAIGFGFLVSEAVRTFGEPVTATRNYLNASLANDTEKASNYACSNVFAPLVDIQVVIGAPLTTVKNYETGSVTFKSRRNLPKQALVAVTFYNFRGQSADLIAELEQTGGKWKICHFNPA